MQAYLKYSHYQIPLSDSYISGFKIWKIATENTRKQ